MYAMPGSWLVYREVKVVLPLCVYNAVQKVIIEERAQNAEIMTMPSRQMISCTRIVVKTFEAEIRQVFITGKCCPEQPK